MGIQKKKEGEKNIEERDRRKRLEIRRKNQGIVKKREDKRDRIGL